MKDSAKNLGTRKHQTMLEGWSSKLALLVQHPSLISKSHLPLDAPKEEYLNEMKVELEGEAGRGLISGNEILEKIRKESEGDILILFLFSFFSFSFSFFPFPFPFPYFVSAFQPKLYQRSICFKKKQGCKRNTLEEYSRLSPGLRTNPSVLS